MAFEKLGKLFTSSSQKAPESVVGIDLGSSSIKVVELKVEDGVVNLETYGELQLGPYAKIEVGRVTNLGPAPLSTALTDIIREARVTTSAAGVAVPYASSFVAVISLPSTDTEALQAMIPIEARKYVPVPIAQVTLDWFVIPEVKGVESDRTHSRVLLAAIHNEALNKFKAVISGAKVVSAFNEIEIFSSIRSTVTSQSDTVMIVDFGASSTKLYIVSQGVVQATHSINVGGQDLTSALSKSLEMSMDAAEELKRQVGLIATDNPRIERAISFPLERIFVDSRRVLDTYERSGGATVSQIVLSGGGSIMQGLEEYAHQIFGRTIVRAHPFSKVRYPAVMEETLREIGPSFAVAVGVALRRLQEG